MPKINARAAPPPDLHSPAAQSRQHSGFGPHGSQEPGLASGTLLSPPVPPLSPAPPVSPALTVSWWSPMISWDLRNRGDTLGQLLPPERNTGKALAGEPSLGDKELIWGARGQGKCWWGCEVQGGWEPGGDEEEDWQ